MTEKTFEEMFPSLISLGDKQIKLDMLYAHSKKDVKLAHNSIIHFFVEVKKDVQQYCLDKQKVRDAIRNPKNFMSSDIGNIPDLEAIEKEG